MNPNKTASIKTLTAIVLTVTVFIASSVIAIAMTHPAEAKFCNPSGCKGTFHYYTVKGHHHCWKGTDGCVLEGSGKGEYNNH